ncbi:MAG TPA: hypothetical protein VKB78_07610, partial [Pirellulales bacterium]|nr:hypothetical protein [Pirellulales bacterium]
MPAAHRSLFAHKPSSRRTARALIAPTRAVRFARYLFLLCVGGLVLTCGGQTFDVHRPLGSRNTAELPSPRNPDPPLTHSGPLPEPASSASKPSVESLSDEELEVAELWRRAMAIDPQHVASRLQLAALFGQTGQTNAALDLCKQAEEIAPQDVMVHVNVGVLGATLQRFNVAEDALRKAGALAPGNAFAARLLSQVLLQTSGNPSEAAALARKAVDREPS